MSPVLKAVFAVVAGVVVGFVVIVAVEGLSGLVFPLPDGVDPTDPDAIREVMHGMPPGALGMVLFAWFLGTLAGAYTAIRLHPTRARWAGLVVAALFAAATVANMTMLPHPVWMVAAAPAALLLALLVAVWLAGRGGEVPVDS